MSLRFPTLTRPLALSPEDIERYHEANGCHLDRDRLVGDTACCMCTETPCEVAVEAARVWLDEQDEAQR